MVTFDDLVPQAKQGAALSFDDLVPDETPLSRTAEAGKAFGRDFVGGLASIPRGASALFEGFTRAIGAGPTLRVNPDTGVIEDAGLNSDPISQAAQAVTEATNRALPADPRGADLITTKMGGAFGSFGAFVAAGLASPPSAVARLATLAGAGSTIGADQLVSDAVEHGADPDTQIKAALAGAGLGLTDIIPVERFFRVLSAPAKSAVLNAFRQGGRQAGFEALQEAGQQVGQNAAARELFDPNRSLLEGADEAGTIGGGVGGIVGGLAGFIGGRRGRGGTPVEPTPVDPGPLALPEPPRIQQQREAAQFVGHSIDEISRRGGAVDIPTDLSVGRPAAEPLQITENAGNPDIPTQRELAGVAPAPVKQRKAKESKGNKQSRKLPTAVQQAIARVPDPKVRAAILKDLGQNPEPIIVPKRKKAGKRPVILGPSGEVANPNKQARRQQQKAATARAASIQPKPSPGDAKARLAALRASIPKSTAPTPGAKTAKVSPPDPLKLAPAAFVEQSLSQIPVLQQKVSTGDAFKNIHKDLVEQAIRGGEKVTAAAIDPYPDLVTLQDDERRNRRSVTQTEAHKKRAKVNPARDDLLTAVSKMGGIREGQGQGVEDILKGSKRQFFGSVVHQPARPGEAPRGRSLDDIARDLQELGYIGQQSESELIDALDTAARGEAVVSPAYDFDKDPGNFFGGATENRLSESAADKERETIAARLLGDEVGAFTVPAVPEAVFSLARDTFETIGGQAITRVRRAGKVSPSFRKLADIMEADPTSPTPVKADHFQRVMRSTGKYTLRLQDSLDRIAGKISGRVSSKVNDKLVSALRGGRADPSIAKASVEIRQLLNGVRADLKDAGVDVGFIPSYFPRIYSKKALRDDEGKDALAAVFVKHGINKVSADKIVEKITDTDGVLDLERLVNPDPSDGRVKGLEDTSKRVLDSGRARRNANLEKSRKLVDIPESELAPFLESNVHDVLTRYIEYSSNRMEMARSFGANEQVLNKLVLDGINESIATGSKESVKDAERARQRAYDLVDAMQKTYKRIQNPVVAKVNTMAVAYQYLRTLPLATISSLSEPFITLERGRLSSTLKAVPATLNHVVRSSARVAYSGLEKADSTRAAEQAGLALDVALAERLTASFGGETTKLTAAFFKANFLHQFTRFTRVFGFEAGKRMVVDNLKDLANGAKGRRGKRFEKELIELGIDPKEGIAWVRAGAKQDAPFFEQVKDAGVRFTNEVVMSPRATVRPMWHSNPHFHLFSQLKGFQTVFGNTVMTRWYRKIAESGAYEGVRNAGNIAAVGVLMTVTAMLGNELRKYVKDLGKDESEKRPSPQGTDAVFQGIERAGFLGVGQFAVDAVYAHRFGSSGLAQVLGPQAGQIEQFGRGIGEASQGSSRRLARETVNAIPIANAIPSVRKAIADRISPLERKSGSSGRARVKRPER